ncbi:protein indeterminate-domain 2-like [Cucurbita maxima]|uniref:Protein indeterminate-domain 2-like n=1 Tax=Cucurbita maxima TaxID=3661 RepID=A0A6J1IVB0_CUCMA|nr:protein indeterminate-domain 2-like [Cucurbita maxima]
MVDLETSSPVEVSREAGLSSSGYIEPVAVVAPPKKKRNLPGMPDPAAEVIALSPGSLLATNRFICEICNKGFQRDQNLQLHRRGHNLPWKLRQRTSNEVRKRVYVCPEPSCVHHNPARALGDLTGIKKHFCRKHGEKKWKCERCSKKYAVQSDWKAHMKTCGTREYKCDCGTLFSRRDSFITHRAFCDVLAEESARAQTLAVPNSEGKESTTSKAAVTSPPPPPLTPSTTVISPALSIHSSELADNPIRLPSVSTPAATTCLTSASVNSTTNASANGSSSNNVFGNCTVFAPSASISGTTQISPTLPPPSLPASIVPYDCASTRPSASAVNPTSLSLSTSLYLSSKGSSLFAPPDQDRLQYTWSTQPAAMSATALLQKAAEMGATASNPSLFRGFGMATSSTGQDTSATIQWSRNLNRDHRNGSSLTAGVGLDLPSGPDGSGLMISGGPFCSFGSQPMTRDLLGLGLGGGGASSSRFSALIASMGGGSGYPVAASDACGGSGNGSPSGDAWDQGEKH